MNVIPTGVDWMPLEVDKQHLSLRWRVCCVKLQSAVHSAC